MSRAKTISVLGATGSVGDATLDVIRAGRREGVDFRVSALTAHQNAAELAERAVEFGAEFAVVADESRLEDLKTALAGTGIAAGAGASGLLEAASGNNDLVVSAIVGVAGLAPTVAALRTGADVALANKESMVCGGELLRSLASECGGTILPIDSEHNAIFQVLDRRERVEKVILTASGGPFWTRSLEFMRSAEPSAALRHPNWSMGAKISIDSATMMNKGLELIEASFLFDLPPERLEVLVHPESIVHSLVSYDDGSMLAQLGQPDMRIPISYALAWPDRLRMKDVARLDLAQVGSLNFEPPDEARFPALRLAREALVDGGTAPLILNSSNEIAVEAYLQGRIGFLGIAEVVEETLDQMLGASTARRSCSSAEDILALDGEVRRHALARVSEASVVSPQG